MVGIFNFLWVSRQICKLTSLINEVINMADLDVLDLFPDYMTRDDVKNYYSDAYLSSEPMRLHPFKDTTVQISVTTNKGRSDEMVKISSKDGITIVGRSRNNVNDFIVAFGNNRYGVMTFDMSSYDINDKSYNGKADYLERGTRGGQFNWFEHGNDDQNFNKFMQNIEADIAYQNMATANGTEENQFFFPNAYTANGEKIVCPTEPMTEEITKIIMEPTIRSYGVPPQWTKYVDPRVAGFTATETTIRVGLGRRYMGVTISNPTILELAPGYIKYSNWLNGVDITGALDEFVNTGALEDATALVDTLTENASNFYEIKPCFTGMQTMGNILGLSGSSRALKVPGYMSYVNVLLGAAAVFLTRGDADKTDRDKSSIETRMQRTRKYLSSGIYIDVPPLSQRIPPGLAVSVENNTGGNKSQPYSQMDWTFYDAPSGYFTVGGYVLGKFAGAENSDTSTNAHGTRFDYIRFYLTGSTTATDEFSTSVEDSLLGTLSSTVNVALKEAAYWAGSALGDIANEASAAVSKIFASNPLGRKLDNIVNMDELIGGAKMVFPKIITESAYGKSIHCECTFPSFYGDEESIYLNTLLAYLHILAFVLPHQVKTRLEMYTFPFLVKAFCRGLFNVDMGAITNFNVVRGGNDNMLWSFKGASEIISVDFEITPLITNLVMTSQMDGAGWFMKNQGLHEYLSSISAFDARNDQYDLALELFRAMLSNEISGKISGILDPLLQSEVVSDIREVLQRLEMAGGASGLAQSAFSDIERLFTPTTANGQHRSVFDNGDTLTEDTTNTNSWYVNTTPMENFYNIGIS